MFKLQWKKPIGLSFELLVEGILKGLFPTTDFVRTKYVHDGGKDFYAVLNDEDDIWVEAKNYNNHLELSKFANTFIMADINKINRIIIFSVSPLTENARLNVARYAAYHNKNISVYEGEAIFSLAKQFSNKIEFNEIFENYIEVKNYIDKFDCNLYEKHPLIVSHKHYLPNQTNFAYLRNKENYLCNADKVNNFSTYAYEIIIKNESLFSDKRLEIKEDSLKNVNFIYNLPDNFNREIVIPASSTVVVILYFKFNLCSESVNLPIVEFKEKVRCINKPYAIECCWLAEIALIGDAFLRLNDFRATLGKEAGIKSAVVYGVSGVGKSRFIRESATLFHIKSYRVISLDFRNEYQLDLRSTLRKILSNIYVLDYEKPNNKYAKELEESYDIFYKIIYDVTYDCKVNTYEIVSLFGDLFHKKKIALLLDNVQDIDSDSTEFLIQLLTLLSDNSLMESFIMLCFNQDFLNEERASNKLFLFLLQLNSCYKVMLQNFNRTDAELYLQNCIDPQQIRPDLTTYYNQIVIKFGTNPFILRQVILYLKQRNIINSINSNTYISNIHELNDVLNELPTGVEQVLHCRYKYLQNELQNDLAIDQIVWSILFLEGTPEKVFKLLKLDKRSLNKLVSYGFVEMNDARHYIFTHQLIEKYFCLNFKGGTHNRIPKLKFFSNETYLIELLNIISQHYKIDYCIQEMLLRNFLDNIDLDNITIAFKKLQSFTPGILLLPLIVSSVVEILNKNIHLPSQLELETVYRICISCQVRCGNSLGAQIFKPLAEFEQITYVKKTDSPDELCLIFKHYVFLLSVEEKGAFLDWFGKAVSDFGLSNYKLTEMCGWIHNRTSKFLCSIHSFDAAVRHAEDALYFARQNKNIGAMAEAEIEYGNIYAYSNAELTATHWQKCVDYIQKNNDDSTYFSVYRLAYGILSKLILHETENLKESVTQLCELRPRTFLYQKLLIDDVYADYCFIKFAEQNDLSLLNNLIPCLLQMKSESYMYRSIFTILASYKLLLAYMLIDYVSSTHDNIGRILNLICELIDNNLFENDRLDFSKMILCDIANYCYDCPEIIHEMDIRLPYFAKTYFQDLLFKRKTEGELPSQTILSDKNKKLNLLTFNYVF